MNKGLTLGLLVAVGLALALRCPRLAQRPMHNDEGVNAMKFGELWEHGDYKYDPNEHHGHTPEEIRKEMRAEADAIWTDEMRKVRDKVADEKNFEVRAATLEDGTVVQVLVPKKS